MNPAHHLNRSRHYLNFTPANIAAGDYARAARALCRSASHAVTAAAVHWHHRHDTRRRLHRVVKALVFDGHLRYTHERTLRQAYALPGLIADAAPAAARRLLRRARRRVSRLIAAVAAAMARQPHPPTLEQILAQIDALSPLPPPPPVTTTGQLKKALGRYVDPEYADHPLDCHGCRINYHGPIPAPGPF